MHMHIIGVHINDQMMSPSTCALDLLSCDKMIIKSIVKDTVISKIHRKNSFAEKFKILVEYRSEK